MDFLLNYKCSTGWYNYLTHIYTLSESEWKMLDAFVAAAIRLFVPFTLEFGRKLKDFLARLKLI